MALIAADVCVISCRHDDGRWDGIVQGLARAVEPVCVYTRIQRLGEVNLSQLPEDANSLYVLCCARR